MLYFGIVYLPYFFNERTKMFFVIFMNMLYAIGFPMTQVALQLGEPLFMTALRMLIGGFILVGFQYIYNPTECQVPLRFIRPLLLSGLFNMYLTNYFELYGLSYMNAAKAAFIYNLSPFIAAFMGYLVLGEQMTPPKWLALIIAFFGSLFILGTESLAEQTLKHIGFISWAEASLLLAATTSVYGCIIIQQLIRSNYNSVMINGMGMIFGGFMALAHSLVTESWNPIPSTNFWPFFGWVLLMVLLYNIITYELYNRLAIYYTVTFLTLSGFVTPIFTAFFDWLWFGNLVGLDFWISSIFTFTGLYLFYKDELPSLGQAIKSS